MSMDSTPDRRSSLSPLVRGLGVTSVVLVALVFAVWWWWNAPWRELEQEMEELGEPPGLVLLGEQRGGDRLCFFDNCNRLTRYYGSDMTPEDLCASIPDIYPTMVRVESLGEGCHFARVVSLKVRGPISEIPPENDNELIDVVPVNFDHASVLVLSIRD